MKTRGNDSITPIDLQKKFENELSKKLSTSSGLTKRELFAALAMQGMVSWGNSVEYFAASEIPKLSVQMADDLIKALNEKTLTNS